VLSRRDDVGDYSACGGLVGDGFPAAGGDERSPVRGRAGVEDGGGVAWPSGTHEQVPGALDTRAVSTRE